MCWKEGLRGTRGHEKGQNALKFHCRRCMAKDFKKQNCKNSNSNGDREVAQPVKCLLCNQEKLSLAPQHPSEKLGTAIHTCSPSVGVCEDRRHSRVHWPAGLAKLTSSRFDERLYLQTHGGQRPESASCSF